MKKLVTTLGVVLAMTVPTIAVAAPAQAAPNKKSCASAAEYKKVAGGRSVASVKKTVGNNGSTRFDFVRDADVIFAGDGYGDYVYDEAEDEFSYVGDFNGDWAEVPVDTDGDEVADDTELQEVGADYTLVTLRDHIRKYAACKGFNGKRPVFVWFDNYTNGPVEGALTVFAKKTSDPLAGTGLRRAPKVAPSSGVIDGRSFHASSAG